MFPAFISRINASQFIRQGLYPTRCLMLFAFEVGDLFDSVKKGLTIYLKYNKLIKII